MPTEYSKGFHSKVYLVSPEQRRNFPRADLVKEDESNDKCWFGRLFYRHKIASSLFPKHFIEIVATQVEPFQSDLYEEFRLGNITSRQCIDRIHRLYSKEAPVSSTHAIFSSHISLGDRCKVSDCSCSECFFHRQLHNKNRLEEKAFLVSQKMTKFGIHPPIYDPSDYCLSTSNEIVFFEIDNFDEYRLRQYLENKKKAVGLTASEVRSLVYCDRINSLHKASRELLCQGLAELRIN